MFFEFEFQEEADTFGSVSISLADGENMKVYYNRNLVNKIDEDSKDEWYAFLKELKDYAVEHQMGFDVRDITKNNLTKQDYENLADTNKTVNTDEMSEELARITKLAGVEKAPVAEGLTGTSKSSFENLNKTKLIIRHKGKVDPYAGNYGISRNPESFAVFGYRKYFTDKDRNAVMRLSQDGLTEISAYGMKDFFRDQLTDLDTVQSTGKVYGGWDNYTKQYVLSLQSAESDKFKTISYDEEVRGWTSFYSYKPVAMFSVKGSFYTVPKDSNFIDISGNQVNINKGIYRHNASDITTNRSTFYGEYQNSSITFIFNPNPSIQKNFKTISYEGSNGWQVESFTSDQLVKVYQTMASQKTTI